VQLCSSYCEFSILYQISIITAGYTMSYPEVRVTNLIRVISYYSQAIYMRMRLNFVINSASRVY